MQQTPKQQWDDNMQKRKKVQLASGLAVSFSCCLFSLV
jgi:hypothetical protein